MKKSLAEQILEISNSAANEDWEPELMEGGMGHRLASDDDDGVSSDDDDNQKRGHYVTVGKSKIKSAVMDMDAMMTNKSKAYTGKRVNRKDLFDAEEESEEEESSSDKSFSEEEEEEIQVNEQDVNNEDGSSEDEVDFMHDEESNEDSPLSESDGESVISQEDRIQKELTQVQQEEKKWMNRISQEAKGDVEKGRHVRNQLALYDHMLDCRIRLQQLVSFANKLPQHPEAKTFYERCVENGDEKDFNDATSNVCNLLMDLLDFRVDLVKNNPTLENTLLPGSTNSEPLMNQDRKRRLKEMESMDLPEKCEMIWQDVNDMDSIFAGYRDDTIKKWNEKVQMAGSMSSQKKLKTINQGVVDQIKSMLNTDRDRLVKRTQLKRSNYKIDKKSEETSRMDVGDNDHLASYDAEIFDDEDFYAMMLKEFIESKMDDAQDDPVALSLRALHIRQLTKKSKKKKMVDTKASKGRKVRYQVHEKLMNYMTPIPRGSWSQERAEDLFSGLFGQSAVKEAVQQPKISGSMWENVGELQILR